MWFLSVPGQTSTFLKKSQKSYLANFRLVSTNTNFNKIFFFYINPHFKINFQNCIDFFSQLEITSRCVMTNLILIQNFGRFYDLSPIIVFLFHNFTFHNFLFHNFTFHNFTLHNFTLNNFTFHNFTCLTFAWWLMN